MNILKSALLITRQRLKALCNKSIDIRNKYWTDNNHIYCISCLGFSQVLSDRLKTIKEFTPWITGLLIALALSGTLTFPY